MATGDITPSQKALHMWAGGRFILQLFIGGLIAATFASVNRTQDKIDRNSSDLIQLSADLRNVKREIDATAIQNEGKFAGLDQYTRDMRSLSEKRTDQMNALTVDVAAIKSYISTSTSKRN